MRSHRPLLATILLALVASAAAAGEPSSEGPFVRVVRIDWVPEDLGDGRLQWELSLEVETRPVPYAVGWWFVGRKLGFLTRHTTPKPAWALVASTPTRATFRIGGVHRSADASLLARYTRFAWKKDIRVLAARLPEPRDLEIAEPEIDPDDAHAPLGPDSRLPFDQSRELIEGWRGERADMDARMLRIQHALDGMEAGERATNAGRLLEEIRGWLAEEGPHLDEVRKALRRELRGMRLKDRVKVNTLHFKVHRQLKLIERMLIDVLPPPVASPPRSAGGR